MTFQVQIRQNTTLPLHEMSSHPSLVPRRDASQIYFTVSKGESHYKYHAEHHPLRHTQDLVFNVRQLFGILV